MRQNLRNLVARIRALGADERGVFMIEHALIMPFLLLLLSGAIDLGYALNQSSSLNNAARAGAQYAMRYPTDTTGIQDVVTKAVSYDPTSLTISSSLSCECSDGTVVSCTSTCSGAAPYSYVTVNVSKTYSSPLPTAMMLGISTLSAKAVMRAN